MAWEWVAPVCTAGVGVVGVAGTYWTGRRGREAVAEQVQAQRDHALQDRTYAEKRDAYAGFLELTTRAQHVASLIRRMPAATPREERVAARSAVLADLEARRSLLRLVAPIDIRQLALDAHRHLLKVLNGATEGRESPKYDNRFGTALLAAMKQDLGYELASKDLEALAWALDDDEEPAAPDSELTAQES